MIKYSDLERYDPYGMHKTYDKWPEIAKESFESYHDIFEFSNIDQIVFAGMGGSGAIGDIFSSILSTAKIHVNVVKGYLLPSTVDSNTLVVTVSVSGNTVETLSILDSAHKIGSKIVAFSSGGKMYDYCVKNKLNHINVPQHHSPRASFTSYFYVMLKVLYNQFNIKKEDIEHSILELEKLNEYVSSSNLTNSNPSLNLAEWVSGIPLIYYPHGLKAAAVRFKNSLQENAKNHAMIEDVIESCHNQIVSWEKSSNVQPILLEGVNDHIKTKERWELLKHYFESKEIKYREITSIKGSMLSKLINLVYLLDYSTIYLAVKSRIDPSPVKSIDFIKQKI